MADHLTQFADYYYVVNQITGDRRRNAMTVFARVEIWLGRELHTMTGEELGRWMAEQIAAGYHPNTVRFWRGLMSPYWRWARETELMPAEQWIGLRETRNPRGASGVTTPRPYNRAEVARFWVDLDEKWPRPERADYYLKRWQRGTSNWTRVADHMRNVQATAIISLALLEGLRATEIFALGIPELHPENAYLLVHGKRVDQRPKMREVPYATDCRAAVSAWLTLRKLCKPSHRSPWLALTRLGGAPNRPMSHNVYESMAGRIGDGYELHRFRHTFATERLRAGVPLEKLQRILGHSTLAQTLAYASLVREDLEKAMDASEERFMAAVGRR